MKSSIERISGVMPSTPAGRLALVTGIVAFILYLLRLTPGPGWYDSPELVGVANTLGVAHPTGYPLYSLAGKIFLLLFGWAASPATVVNLLSAVAGGATLGVMTLVSWRIISLLRLGPMPLGLRLIASVVPSAVLGGMALFMEQAVVAEVYTLHTLLTTLLLLIAFELVMKAEKPAPLMDADELRMRGVEVWGVAGWRLPVLLAFVAGLGLGNHFTIVLYFPALAVLLWWARSPETELPSALKPETLNRSLPTIAVPLLVVLLTGFSLYLLVPVRASLQPPFNWGEAVTVRRFLRLVTAAEARARPAQYIPVTALSIWGNIAAGMSLPVFLLSVAGWGWAGVRRIRLGVVALVYILFPVLFLLLGLDILEDSLLPVHLWIALGAGALVALAGERLVAVLGPGMGGRVAFACVALLLVLGPGLRIAHNWHEVSAPEAGGPSAFLEAVTASVAGESEPETDVSGWVFSEENSTAFLLWHQERTERIDTDLHGIYLLLAREEWYREELRRNIESLSVPELDRSYETLPHSAAAGELLGANAGGDQPLYLSPVVLPPGEVYGVLVPQGVLLRMEPPGYVPSREDLERHASIMSVHAPAFGSGPVPHLDRQSRDWWSWRHSLLGNAWLRLGLLPAAEAEFSAGVHINPERLETWMELAFFYKVVGDYRSVEAALREAEDLFPREGTVRLELARALTRLRAFAEADSVLHARRLRDVMRSEYLRVNAGIELGLGEASAALTDLEEAVRLDPESAEIWNDLGVVYLRKGQWDDAVEAFQVAVELQPALAEAWVNLGTLAMQDAKWEDAERYLSNALDAGASIDQIGYALGVARMNLHDFAGAEEAWRQNLRDWPLHADTYIALGSLLEQQGRIREAISVYENGRMAIPGDGRFGSRLRELRPPRGTDTPIPKGGCAGRRRGRTIHAVELQLLY